MYFDELELNDKVLDALYDMRFDTCTPVQEKCIPEILNGRDVLGVAQTGTGKTAAYLLPILSKLQDGGYPKDSINCIVMSPTRELAQQIDQAMQGFAYYLDGISSVAIYGGNDGSRYEQELRSLSLGADVIIATPGRLLSHLNIGNADFSKVSFFVLDEADRMLDMGFSDDIKKIAKELPNSCQTIMFSATMPEKIEELAKTLLNNPVEVKIAVSKPADKIKQSAYVCYENQKIGIIKDIFKRGDLKRVIIFSGKKQKVKLINHALTQLKINSGEMHSDLEQAQRDEIMYKFKSGQIDVLVATDIVSRGIDIDDIAMVINFDVPRDAEDYVHRIGRTARADRDGVAITFISDADVSYFKQIEKLLGKEVEKAPLPDGLGNAPEYKLRNKGAHGDHRGYGNNRPSRRNGEGEHSESKGKRPKENGEHGSRNQRDRHSRRYEQSAQPQQANDTRRHANESSVPEQPTTENAKFQEGKKAHRHNHRGQRRGDRQNAERPQTEGKATQPQERRKPTSETPNTPQTNSDNSRRRQRRRPSKPRHPDAPQNRATATAERKPTQASAPQKQESKIKSILSKPLKWLGLKK